MDKNIRYSDYRTKMEMAKEADTLRRMAAYLRGKKLTWDPEDKIYA